MNVNFTKRLILNVFLTYVHQRSIYKKGSQQVVGRAANRGSGIGLFVRSS